MSDEIFKDIEKLNISRRKLLHVMGGSFIFFLPMLKCLRAEALTNPSKRFLFVYMPMGVVNERQEPNFKDQFFPDVAGRNFTLSPILSPLAALKSKLIVIDGVHINSRDRRSLAMADDGGHVAMGNMLTGRYNVGETSNRLGPIMGAYGGGVSLDYFLSQQASVVSGTAVSMINLGVNPLAEHAYERSISYSGAGLNNQILPYNNPVAAFDRLFGSMNLNSNSSQAELDRIRLKKKSVLDVVIKEFNNLKNILSANEVSSIQDHMDAVHTIEREISTVDTIPTPEQSCTPPQKPQDFDIYQSNLYKANLQFEKIMKVQFDLIETAFKCDRTRIATILIESEGSQQQHPFLASRIGVAPSAMTGHHGLTHNPPSHWAKLTEIRKWYMEHVAKLAQNLNAVNTTSGSMLDQSVIWVGGVLGRSYPVHKNHRVPTALIGGAGGYFDTGQSIIIDKVREQNVNNQWGISHTSILSAIMNAMGVKQSTFGDPRFAEVPFSKIVKAS
ncbi:MAG: DUF1552 domain-containing protein [Bdellovibrionales bacterium]|nr:DUF1552 domain-containing protein [Bdellovibrionales bacterium]